MSLIFEEGRLELTFDNTWRSLVKWDQERAYLHGIRTLQTTRAVDFCGVRDPGDRVPSLYLMELKDFRGSRIENKKRLPGVDTPPCTACGALQPNLYQEVGFKVRDTLAGLVSSAHRRETEPERWRPIADALTRWDHPIQVILWLEEDLGSRSPGRPSSLIDQLKKQLRWLTSRVMVVSSEQPPPGITVRHLEA